MGRVLGILAKTTAFYVLVVLGATFAMYTLLWAAPGDLVDVFCPRGCNKDIREQLVKERGLDKALPVQYATWLFNASRLKLGTSASYRQGAPVKEILGRAVWKTANLVLGATLLTLLLAGLMVWRPASRLARLLSLAGRTPLFLLSFVPSYILAYWAVMASGRLPPLLVKWGLLSKKTLAYMKTIDFLPLGQQVSSEAPFFYIAVPVLVAIVLLAIGNNNLAEQTSGMRAEVEGLRRADFIRATTARGGRVWRHMLHNLLLPLIGFFTGRAILLLGTVVIIETVLNITGVGWLLWEAAKKRDTPVVLAIALFATIAACGLQMINDLALRLIDPRLREEG